MKFTWDQTKQKTNLAKHGFDFADAEAVFAGMTYTFGDNRTYYGEDRFITLGMLKGRIVVIAHTEQDDEIRIISMRKATKHEQKTYFEGFGH
ncbi:BrnT family toxin [Desulfonema magnum]|uniref:Toxin-antitoxin system, toxin component, type II BrnT n=1 Tax=Desulfonema magnum TaxID=45655 RepID=A0A975BNF0_9BACT|nr:BrnT family toxin [Desulfonema magnum]QTA88703.1 Putative toxin-antitoxin system, toxin component, type II BrnT [Desulfonema magnum]